MKNYNPMAVIEGASKTDVSTNKPAALTFVWNFGIIDYEPYSGILLRIICSAEDSWDS